MSRVILALVASLLTASAGADAQSNQSNVINTFGNWRIELEESNQSLRLVGIVTEGNRGFFSVTCYASANWYMIFVSIFDERERRAAINNKYVNISVWNEAADSVQLRMLTEEGRFAIAIAKPGNVRGNSILEASGLAFLAKLNEARNFFAIELGGPSRTYDAKHLPAARTRFASLCDQAHSDWSELLRKIR